MPSTVLKHFMKGRDTKFYRYPCEPECQRRWILPGTRCDWGSNRSYPRIEELFCRRFAHIATLEVVPVQVPGALEGSDDPCSESYSSKFTDGLNYASLCACVVSEVVCVCCVQVARQKWCVYAVCNGGLCTCMCASFQFPQPVCRRSSNLN